MDKISREEPAEPKKQKDRVRRWRSRAKSDKEHSGKSAWVQSAMRYAHVSFQRSQKSASKEKLLFIKPMPNENNLSAAYWDLGKEVNAHGRQSVWNKQAPFA